MPFHQPEKLANLIRFGLPADFLKIEQLDDFRVNEQVMTSSNAGQPESEGLRQTANVIETGVGGRSQQFLGIHAHPNPGLRRHRRRCTPHQSSDHFVNRDSFALGREVQNQPVP